MPTESHNIPRCMGPHPGARRSVRYAGRLHLAGGPELSVAVRFTGRVWAPGAAPPLEFSRRTDRVFLRHVCPAHDCRYISEYEIVVPSHERMVA